MSTRICILALIGLPATGKTTFSKWLLMLPQAPLNVIHICYDDHLEAANKSVVSGSDFKNQRNEILSIVQMLIEALKSTNNNMNLPHHLSSLVKASLHPCKHDFLLICDDNNYYRSMRYKLYQIARQNECAYAQIHFDATLKLAMERNDARQAEQRVPLEVMQRMAERLEIPDTKMQHWESNTFLLSSAEYEDYNILRTQILAFISQTFENKLLPLITMKTNEDARESVQSVMHQLDLLLRKRIGDILQASNANDASARQKLAKILCDKRKTILNDAKAKYEKDSSSIEELSKYVNMLY